MNLVSGRIYKAVYAGLSAPAFDVAKRRKAGKEMQKEFPEFAHIIWQATKDACADYLTPEFEETVLNCTTANEIMALFPCR